MKSLPSMQKIERDAIPLLRKSFFFGLFFIAVICLATYVMLSRTEPRGGVSVGAPCTPSGDGISCSGQLCEQAGNGRFLCPGNLICERQEAPNSRPPIVCQQAPDGGGTITRPPTTADENESFTAQEGECRVGMLIRMGLKDQASGRIVLTQNLAHGFSEVVIPSGQEATVVTFEPVPSETGSYKGTFTGVWEARDVITQQTLSQTASAREQASDIVQNFIHARRNWRSITGASGSIQEHTVTGTWVPDSGGSCTVTHSFQVVYAGPAPSIPALRLRDFVEGHAGTGYGGVTGTRGFTDDPPKPHSRPGEVIVPIGIYWDIGLDCCGIRNARAKVIQFARAAIDGPGGRYAKDWTLDIREDEMSGAPNHDPTYTNHPDSDDNERPNNAPQSGGGTARVGNGLIQWDAPGMPQTLYDRLLHAEASSTYRQQLLSLLVCRPPTGSKRHQAPFYLSKALVKQVALTTITWQFPGQRGIDRRRAANLRQPTITTSFVTMDARCRPISEFLSANNLMDSFNHPDPNDRSLKILSQLEYNRIKDSIEGWADDPAGSIQ